VVAADLARRSPVLGEKIVTEGEPPAFAGRYPDPIRTGISGDRPDHARAECETVMRLFKEVWQGKFFDLIPTLCSDTIVCQTVRMRRALGLSNYQLETMNLMALIPDAQVEVRDICVHDSADLGLRVATIWALRGTYSGAPFYGPTNRAPLTILGSSHFEFRNGEIIREWRIYDEIAVIAQILAHQSKIDAAGPAA
jgi:predicted ester cyclase